MALAKKYKVSSSYLKRVCRRMHVPTPPVGYWAKHAVGKAPPRVRLADPRPGDELEWCREGEAKYAPPTLPQGPDPSKKRRSRSRIERPSHHVLLTGAREFYEAGRVSSHDYLKPYKKLLLDLVVSKAALPRALEVAQALYLKLEERGHHVALSKNGERLKRELPTLWQGGRPELFSMEIWSPMRPTVVYVGTVAIGLTIYELAEEVEVVWKDGRYHRAEVQATTNRRAHWRQQTWKHTRHMPIGKVCIHAYSPYLGTTWSQVWCETQAGDMEKRLLAIAKELERQAPAIVELVAEAERLADIERQRWEKMREEWRGEEAERKQKQAIKDSREELEAIIAGWAEANRIEAFFRDVESRARALGEDQYEIVAVRASHARALLGGSDALERFKKWRAPQEY